MFKIELRLFYNRV